MYAKNVQILNLIGAWLSHDNTLSSKSLDNESSCLTDILTNPHSTVQTSPNVLGPRSVTAPLTSNTKWIAPCSPNTPQLSCLFLCATASKIPSLYPITLLRMAHQVGNLLTIYPHVRENKVYLFCVLWDPVFFTSPSPVVKKGGESA